MVSLARARVVLWLLQLLSFKVSYSVLGLESVHVKVPMAVLVGSSVTLVCECDLPDEDLYSVKWYKGKHEFFRYTSKEIPSIKIFPKAGISVEVNLSNASHLVLVNAEPQTSGKYSCEITEAAPSFHTKIATRTMNVVDPPATDPAIADMKPYYGADEFLEVACTAGPSLPAAKLEWFINDQPLPQPLPAGPSRLEFLTFPAAKLQRPPESPSSPNRTEPGADTGTGNPTTTTTTTTSTILFSSSTSSSTGTSSGSTSGQPASSEHRKSGGSNRYEQSVSRLKLLLEHGHFATGKLKVECVAHIFDLYRRSAVALADENYPQVRVLSNSDNGVHFSFMSDKDDGAPSSASGRPTPPELLTDLLGKTSYFISVIGTWTSGLARDCCSTPSRSFSIDTGQSTRSHVSNRDRRELTGPGCILRHGPTTTTTTTSITSFLLAALGSHVALRAVGA